ncbi:cytochrome c and c1 heme-lyase [Rickenella mellea]|uniref:Holocytochrome c-type synthase n=1 Tax=Rickenella mellea TaxID=50990 RepID=A0A4Y7QHX9_9AGAM|nr:cytochrome c and c1 heme-lyase [Rickenella mellea]
MGEEKCPVDKSSRQTWRRLLPWSSTPTHSNPHPESNSVTPRRDECPIDHSSSKFTSNTSHTNPHDTDTAITHPSLPSDREISSIPRADGERWVYPSQAQFYAAMARKNHNPQASDMNVVVPIHNAVNERAWGEVLAWEAGRGGEKCGGVKLVSFKGRPGQLSIRARVKTLLGYQSPFDRHDWTVDRCGTRLRYIIDFYTGRSARGAESQQLAFYLDVRPAIDNWEGAKMRVERFWERWVGKALGSSPQASSKTS